MAFVISFVMDHWHSSSGSDQSCQSATAEEDHWVHSKNIGAGGFGVVKLFVNQVCMIYEHKIECQDGIVK